MLQLLDKEDEYGVVEDNFVRFQELYHPVWQESFKDVMELQDGKFVMDPNDRAAQRLLALNINDNVYKNIDKFSVLLFNEELKFNKDRFEIEEKEFIVEKMLEAQAKTFAQRLKAKAKARAQF